MRVLLIEDDALLRSSLSAALRQQGMQVAGVAATASLAVRLAEATSPDGVIADIDLGSGPSGLDAVRAILRTQPSAGVVVLTSFDDPRLAGSSRRLIPEHAQYLVKGRVTDAAEVARALVRSVEAARKAGEHGGLTASPSPARAQHGLTNSSLDVLRLLAAGLSNAQIAEARGVSVKSVEVAITRLARKFAIDPESGNTRVLLTRHYFELSGKGISSGLS